MGGIHATWHFMLIKLQVTETSAKQIQWAAPRLPMRSTPKATLKYVRKAIKADKKKWRHVGLLRGIAACSQTGRRVKQETDRKKQID